MADVRTRVEWGRMSSLMALIANVNRPKSRRAYKPADFDPHAQARRKQAVSVEQLANDIMSFTEGRRRKSARSVAEPSVGKPGMDTEPVSALGAATDEDPDVPAEQQS